MTLFDTVPYLNSIVLPSHYPKGKVAILGVKFIMDRDFPIWDRTFSNHGFEPVKTSKKQMLKGMHEDWVVLKCLDLFDGQSHCIDAKALPELKPHQKVSRLYGLRRILWNKDRFCETMNSALEGFLPDIEFVFPCWMLPKDYTRLIKQSKTIYEGRSFILKPTDRGEGNGIIVLDTVQQLSNWKSRFPDNDEVVVQTYLPNPFLINGRKWDMRTYVLVTSVSPLRLYMYRDGLVRFASSQYDKDAKGGGKATSFLTNTSVNKKGGAAVDDLTWPFPKVYRWLNAHGIDAGLLWQRIERAVTQMMLTAEPSFINEFRKLKPGFQCTGCYQLLGVDVIVDDQLVPRVIEVNGEPSMQLTGEVGSHYDHTKTGMTSDLVSLVFDIDEKAASIVASDFFDLELEGVSIGFEDNGGCTSTNDFCLTTKDLEYLLEMRRESSRMGGFRRLYPSREGDFFDSYVNHVKRKFPSGYKLGSFRLHKLVTALEKLTSPSSFNNSIDDPLYRE